MFRVTIAIPIKRGLKVKNDPHTHQSNFQLQLLSRLKGD